MAIVLDTAFWLTVLNYLLGIATAGLVALVAGAAFQDLYLRATSTRRMLKRDTRMLKGMGITMHDGGRPIDEIQELRKGSPVRREDLE
jgi:hypothetical protein